MRKTYLSMQMSRAWGMDNPVGDPFGGPAYLKRESMAIVAVAGAAAGIATGVGMLAAGTAILGSTILGTVVAGALIAGGTLTIVGTLTGNKKLTRIGNTLSLVSGLGAAAASMTGTMTSTSGLSSASAASAGAKMSLGDATQIGINKISTSFDAAMGTHVADTTNSWFGAGNLDKLKTINESGGQTPPPPPPPPDASTSMTTSEKALTAGMVTQGIGSYMQAGAAEKAAEYNKEQLDRQRADQNYVPRLINNQADLDREIAAGNTDIIKFFPKTPTLVAPVTPANPTTPQNFNVAQASPSQAGSVVSAVQGAVDTRQWRQPALVQAPTFTVPNIRNA